MFFSLNKRKNIINEPLLDLRKYTPSGLENVKIINAAIVILPENPSGELMNAYANVKIKNTSFTLNLPDDKKIVTFNGSSVLGIENVVPNAIHISNGITVLKYFQADTPVEIISNGIMVYGKNSKTNILSQNGLCTEAPFEIASARIYSRDIGIDSIFIENLPDNTVVTAGHNIVIYNDVSLQLLKSKNIYFTAGKLIKCDYSILGYIQTVATAGDKIQVNE